MLRLILRLMRCIESQSCGEQIKVLHFARHMILFLAIKARLRPIFEIRTNKLVLLCHFVPPVEISNLCTFQWFRANWMSERYVLEGSISNYRYGGGIVPINVVRVITTKAVANSENMVSYCHDLQKTCSCAFEIFAVKVARRQSLNASCPQHFVRRDICIVHSPVRHDKNFKCTVGVNAISSHYHIRVITKQ